jgi:hypothetical protein
VIFSTALGLVPGMDAGSLLRNPRLAIAFARGQRNAITGFAE